MASGSYLGCDHALLQPAQVGVAPGTRRPGRNIAKVLAEAELSQLVLEKLPDVPRQVVVAGKEEVESENEFCEL